MKSIFGTNIKISIFGESHNSNIGVTINGIKAGIKLDLDFIKNELHRRRPNSSYSTLRIEEDNFEFISGLFNGYTTSSPLTIIVKNENVISSSYDQGILRPSTSDYPSFIRSNGYNDYRGSGHFSGRITVLLVIAGAICKQILKTKNINIEATIDNIGGFKEYEEVLKNCSQTTDSVGGVIKAVATGVPAGVGEPFFDSVESVLSHLLFSIPAVKGVTFGDIKPNNFGSEVVDNIYIENDEIKINTNYNGGINGGLTNGNPIVCYVQFKPTPTIARNIKTVDLKSKTNIETKIVGRHDICLVLRCPVIIEACIAIGLLDLLATYNSEVWM